MNILEYYATHGVMTNPLDYIGLYEAIPYNLSDLARSIYNVTIHFQYINKLNSRDVIGRIQEIYIRKISDRLKKLTELGISNFTKEYKSLQKTICTCRDYALLLCSMLRHNGIPSRVRYGFAQYLDRDPNFFFDHTIVEYWDKEFQVWRLTERYLTEEIKKSFNIIFDIYDVPKEKFISASQAWLSYRKQNLNPNIFGNGYIKRRSGIWYLRNKLIQDLAALNKMEMQPSDLWGYMVDGKIRNILTSEEVLLMDDIAEILINPDDNILKLQDYYLNNPLLKVGPQVYRVAMNGKYWIENI